MNIIRKKYHFAITLLFVVTFFLITASYVFAGSGDSEGESSGSEPSAEVGPTPAASMAPDISYSDPGQIDNPNQVDNPCCGASMTNSLGQQVSHNPSTGQFETSSPTSGDGGDGGSGGGGSSGIVPKQIIPPTFTASSSGGDGGDSVSGTNISINIGDTVTLSWTCYDSFSSGGLNFSTGDATSGSVEVTPEMTTEYELLCSNAGKSTVTITVLVPELSITADPDLVRINHVTDIIWSSTNVKSCSVSEDNPDYVDYWNATSGRETTSKITSETNYTLLCDNGFRFFMDSVKVRLIPIFEEF
jgi:hypothetical protein